MTHYLGKRFLSPRSTYSMSCRALLSLRSSHPLRSLSSTPSPPLSEQSILTQLSSLLQSPTPNPNTNPQFRSPLTPSQLLSPSDKLRGTFLSLPKSIPKSALHSALSATSVHLTLDIFLDVLNNGNLNAQSILSFFDWAITQPNLPKHASTYNALLKALGRRKSFPLMESTFFLRMKHDGINPDLETLEVVLDSFVRSRRVARAVEVFERLEEVGLRCDGVEECNVLVRCLCRRSHVKVASSLFGKMGERTKEGYDEIIGGWALFGRVDKVDKYWEMMVGGDGLRPDEVTVSYRIEALGRAGRVKDARDVFERIGEMGCAPSVVTYNALIMNYICVGDLEEGMKCYKEMCGKDNCLPDIETYDKLIGALLKGRRVADALELFDEMLGRGVFPSMGMLTSFLEPLCSFGPPHAAMMIYRKSKKVGCRLSMKGYKLLLMRLSRFGKSGMVLKMWEEMQECGYSSDKEVYEYIVNGLCNIGQVDNAVLVVEEALRNCFCLGKVVYSKLNSKLMEMNKVETAYKLFLKVKGVQNSVNSRRFWRANGWHF